MLLTPQLLRELNLADQTHPHNLPHICACSGLVELNGRWFAVSDDEHHLLAFDLDPHAPVQLIRLFDGDLPLDSVQRKSQKPDLEVLTTLPASTRHPHGALLALGSGSKPIVRERGVCISLAKQGALASPQYFSLVPLYTPLRKHFADLNIEGAFFAGDTVRLLQRGNASDTPTACVSYAAREMLNWIAGETSAIPCIAQIDILELGKVEGVPLSATDAAPASTCPRLRSPTNLARPCLATSPAVACAPARAAAAACSKAVGMLWPDWIPVRNAVTAGARASTIVLSPGLALPRAVTPSQAARRKAA